MHALATGADQHGVARAVLEKHARLIDIQCRREREELENVRVQRITRWLILSAVAALLLGIAGRNLHRGRQSEALVVEPFRVPAGLSQAGLGGEVIGNSGHGPDRDHAGQDPLVAARLHLQHQLGRRHQDRGSGHRGDAWRPPPPTAQLVRQ